MDHKQGRRECAADDVKRDLWKIMGEFSAQMGAGREDYANYSSRMWLLFTLSRYFSSSDFRLELYGREFMFEARFY